MFWGTILSWRELRSRRTVRQSPCGPNGQAYLVDLGQAVYQRRSRWTASSGKDYLAAGSVTYWVKPDD